MIWIVFFIINFCLFIIKLESINYTDFGFTCKYLFSVDMVMGETGQLHLNIILVIRYFLYVLLKVGIRVSVWNNIIYWKLICCLGNCSREKVVRRKKKLIYFQYTCRYTYKTNIFYLCVHSTMTLKYYVLFTNQGKDFRERIKKRIK